MSPKKKHKYRAMDPDEFVYRYIAEVGGKEHFLRDLDGRIIAAPMVCSEEKPGIFCGISDDLDCGQFVGVPQGTDGNFLVVGGCGTGKSSGIAMPTLATWKGAICALDIKGELSASYMRLYEEGIVSRPCIVFDFLDPESLGYDPYWWLNKDGEDHLFQNVNEIALALIPPNPNERTPFWDDSERAILTACMLYYLKARLSFSETLCIILTTPLRELCIMLSERGDHMIRTLLGNIGELSDETFAGIERGLRNKIMQLTADPYLCHAFRGESEAGRYFTWDALDEYQIFIRIAIDRIEQWGGAIVLMLTQLIRYLERRPDKHLSESSSVQTLLLLDEFAQFGRLDVVTKAMTTLRSKCVNFLIMVQSLAQIDKIYGVFERRIICDNCWYQVLLGANDTETQRYFAERIGTVLRKQKGRSVNFDKHMQFSGCGDQTSMVREWRVFPEWLSTLDTVSLLTPFGYNQITKLKPSSFTGQEDFVSALKIFSKVAKPEKVSSVVLKGISRTLTPGQEDRFRVITDGNDCILEPIKPMKNAGAKLMTIEDRCMVAQNKMKTSLMGVQTPKREPRSKKKKVKPEDTPNDV